MTLEATFWHLPLSADTIDPPENPNNYYYQTNTGNVRLKEGNLTNSQANTEPSQAHAWPS